MLPDNNPVIIHNRGRINLEAWKTSRYYGITGGLFALFSYTLLSKYSNISLMLKIGSLGLLITALYKLRKVTSNLI